MRILFSSPPGWGHIHPLMPLAAAFQARGHDVLWATGPDSCARVEQAGVRTLPAGLDAPARMRTYRARYPEAAQLPPEQLPPHMFPRLFGEISTPAMLADLLPIARDWQPALIVHDVAEFAAPLVAALLGVPHVAQAFGSLVPRATLAAAGDEVAPVWRAAGLEPRAFGGSVETLYLDIYPPSMQSPEIADLPATQLLRPVPFDAVAGDRLPDGFGGDRERPLVYLTFGTIFNENPTFAAALEAIRVLDVQLLVTVGPSGDTAAFGPQPANVRIERYVPQTLLFRDCDLVVSHGGSGTMLGALEHALPQLCLPQAADQFRNAANCARAGAGLALAPGDADRDAIRAAVELLLAEPSYRAAAAEIAREIAAMPTPAQVAAVVERLA